MMSNQCEHGRLARKCEICEYEREIAGLRAEVLELENNQACDVCSPDDYGWQHNAVEGRVPCVCITESGAYQELETERDQLRAEVKRLREQIICYEGECDGVNCSNCGTINKEVDDEV